VFNCFAQHFCLHFEYFQLSTAPVYIAFLHFMGDDNDAKNLSYNLEVGGSSRKFTFQGIPRSTRDSHRKITTNMWVTSRHQYGNMHTNNWLPRGNMLAAHTNNFKPYNPFSKSQTN
ncbi:hypothetical protein KI387_036037, partial [Taxus chinensis]